MKQTKSIWKVDKKIQSGFREENNTVMHWKLTFELYLKMSAVKRLIVINRIQNKSIVIMSI